MLSRVAEASVSCDCTLPSCPRRLLCHPRWLWSTATGAFAILVLKHSIPNMALYCVSGIQDPFHILGRRRKQ
ncbi:hypothetical protein BJX66DRAFT_309397 [Aspergillus keveii]|uniref:Uncharacterized protein n=1 Tax=Aspergillus keveii TaxID=714993 RepID=A0ABR4FXZ5_9EURO